MALMAEFRQVAWRLLIGALSMRRRLGSIGITGSVQCGGLYMYRPGIVLFLEPFVVVPAGFLVANTLVGLFSEAYVGVLPCLAPAPPHSGQAALVLLAYFADKAVWTSGGAATRQG